VVHVVDVVDVVGVVDVVDVVGCGGCGGLFLICICGGNFLYIFFIFIKKPTTSTTSTINCKN